MALPPREVGKVSSVANLTASGVIGTASVDTDVRVIAIAQTTAGLTFTLPNPSDTSAVIGLDVINTGTAAFTLYGTVVMPSTALRCAWTGTAWIGEAVGFIKATVASLNALTNLVVGTPAFASNGRAITGVGALGGGFTTQATTLGTGCAVTCATSTASASTWVISGTTQALAA